ncbi:MAG: YceD family protein [Faecalibacterium sp.]
MLFDLKKYFSAGISPDKREFQADFSDCDFSGATIKEPVTVYFVAERFGSEVSLTLTAEATITANCARCLDEIKQTEKVQLEWLVKESDLDDPDFELPVDEKGKLDVKEWTFQEFTFEIPTVLVCSTDCEGLCPVCGKKVADCTCQAAEADAAAPPLDPRLSILKSLLN